jgi:SulP family sulfate permease
VAIGSASTGLCMLALGLFGLGGLVRFMPYPVIAGFLAGTGWLLMLGALGLMTGLNPTPAAIGQLLGVDMAARWLPGVAVTVVLNLALRRLSPLLAIPGVLLGSVAAFYLAVWLGGGSYEVVSAAGWTLGPFPAGSLLRPIGPADLGLIHWPALLSQAGALATVPLMSVIPVLLNISGIELSVGRDVDVDRELRVAGAGNLAASLAGGIPGYHIMSLTLLMHRMGVRSRLGGIVAALVLCLPLLVSPALLAYLPKLTLGGLLLFFGWSFFREWVLVARARLPRLDYAIVLLILVVIAARDFLTGVGVGLLAAVALFVVEYSRVQVVRRALSGATRRSRYTRTPAERDVLDAQGGRVAIMELQGYIFFGTAEGLIRRVRPLFAEPAAAGPRFLILDFARVTGVDSSALYAFTRLRQMAEASGATVVLTGPPAAAARQIEAAGLVGERLRLDVSLDRGIEWCEQALIRDAGVSPSRTVPIEELLHDVLPDPASVGRLRGYLVRQEVGAGETLISQGAAAGDMLFIETGTVSAQLERPGQPPVRLQTMDGGNVVGEIGLYLGTPRTAVVVSDTPCVVYRLDVATLQRMRGEAPDLAAAIHEHIARLMAGRLVHTIRALDSALDA